MTAVLAKGLAASQAAPQIGVELHTWASGGRTGQVQKTAGVLAPLHPHLLCCAWPVCPAAASLLQNDCSGKMGRTRESLWPGASWHHGFSTF